MPTGSPELANTIGMVEVAALTASEAFPPNVTMRSTFSPTSSAASEERARDRANKAPPVHHWITSATHGSRNSMLQRVLPAEVGEARKIAIGRAQLEAMLDRQRR